jgi:DNA-binding transcriptional LysR family regulator
VTGNINTLDLNLLRVFNAVLEEGNVLRASKKLCLSQSAVSHSLSRLRGMLGDELFVRTATGMQPTARALAMAPLVRNALQSLDAAIGLPNFDPATSSKRFTIAANDFTTMVVIPHLLEILQSEAPFVDLVIKPVTRIDLAEQIDLGRIDAAIGTFAVVPPRFKASLLFEYDDVLITNAAQTAKDAMTIAALSERSLAVVSFGGDQEGAVDGFISERGLARRSEMYDQAAFERAFSTADQVPRIAVSLPHFLALPALLDGSKLAAIVPRPLAQAFARASPIVIHELPYVTTMTEVRALWHERSEGELSQAWLRTVMKRATHHLRINRE